MRHILYPWIILNALLWCITTGFPQWQLERLPTNGQLWDVFYADSMNGWIASDSGVFITEDGGESWSLVYPSRVPQLAGIGENEVWAMGRRDTVLHTSDKGLAWNRLSLGDFTGLDSIKGLTRLYSFGSKRLWVCAIIHKDGDDQRVIIKSSDAGVSWGIDSLSGYKLYANKPSIQFVDSLTGWILTSSVLHTTDGGASWDSISDVPLSKTILDMHFLTQRKGWIVHEGPLLTTSIQMTDDGGYTWRHQKDFQCSALNASLRFADSLAGWAVEQTCLNGLEILGTTDGGISWKLQSSEGSLVPRKIWNIDRHNAWIIGDSGKILHTTNGGGITSVTDNPHVPPEPLLLQNFPNPFNSSTTIVCSARALSRVNIKIYNSLGRLVRYLTANSSSGGNELTVQWNGTDNSGRAVPTGTYFYEIETGGPNDMGRIQWKKMNLIR